MLRNTEVEGHASRIASARQDYVRAAPAGHVRARVALDHDVRRRGTGLRDAICRSTSTIVLNSHVSQLIHEKALAVGDFSILYRQHPQAIEGDSSKFTARYEPCRAG